jgi:hypothetical protein
MRQEKATPGPLAQPAWGFHDETGTIGYELVRVYRAADPGDRRGPVCRLDEGATHWRLTLPLSLDQQGRLPASRSVTWTDARHRGGPRLTFEHFTSPHRMGGELPLLLGVVPRVRPSIANLVPQPSWSAS